MVESRAFPGVRHMEMYINAAVIDELQRIIFSYSH